MRLADIPEPYAIVVMLPGEPPAATTVNGRIARMIAWLLDHRIQVEAMRGTIAFHFGDRGFQAEMRETFPYERVAASTADLPPTIDLGVVEDPPDEDNTSVLGRPQQSE